MMPSNLSSKKIVYTIFCLLIVTATCNVDYLKAISNSPNENSEFINEQAKDKDYIISFTNVNFCNDEVSFDMIYFDGMFDATLSDTVNDNIIDSTTGWIDGKAKNFDTAKLYIYFHSNNYLSFVNSLGYEGVRIDCIDDYVTIDVNTGKRIMLNDLVEINEEFVKYIQKSNVAKGSRRKAQYNNAPKDLWEYLNEFTTDELLEELKKCSYTQEQVIQDGYYPIDKSIGSLLYRNSFYLQNNKLMIVLNNNIYMTFLLDDISDFLKVPKW